MFQMGILVGRRGDGRIFDNEKVNGVPALPCSWFGAAAVLVGGLRRDGKACEFESLSS